MSSPGGAPPQTKQLGRVPHIFKHSYLDNLVN